MVYGLLDSPKRKVKLLLLYTVVMFLMICFSNNVRANEKILIAAASDLNFAMNEICRAFEKLHPGIKVEVSYGSSGNFLRRLNRVHLMTYSSLLMLLIQRFSKVKVLR